MLSMTSLRHAYCKVCTVRNDVRDSYHLPSTSARGRPWKANSSTCSEAPGSFEGLFAQRCAADARLVDVIGAGDAPAPRALPLCCGAARDITAKHK